MKEFGPITPETNPNTSKYFRSESDDWKTLEETSKEIWQKFGSKDIRSFEDYLNAKKEFDRLPQIGVIIRGGGPSALLMTRQLLASDPKIHITILEKDGKLGGMGVNAISPFVDNHIDTVLAQEKLIFQVLADPRVEAITGFEVSMDEILKIAELIGAQFVVDAAGAEPNKIEGLSYGKYVMTSNDYLDLINGRFNEDGHFGRVDVPTKRGPDGRPFPTIIAAGGNQSRDLQKAGELVFLADRWARELGLSKDSLDIEHAASEGIRKARLDIGLPDDARQETQILYRGLDWKMKKLLKSVGSLPYGDPELRRKMDEQIRSWEQADGGRYISMHEIVDVEEKGDHPLIVTLKNNESGEFTKVEAGNIVTAIRFESRPEVKTTILVGIAVKGAADLSSTGLHIVKEAIPRVKKDLPNTLPLLRERKRRENTDPILEALQNGPQYLIKIGFRK